MTPVEEEAYNRELCSFDSLAFVELSPSDEAFGFCMDMEYSGNGPSDDPEFGSLVRFQFFD